MGSITGHGIQMRAIVHENTHGKQQFTKIHLMNQSLQKKQYLLYHESRRFSWFKRLQRVLK